MTSDHALGFLFKQIHDSFEADMNKQLNSQNLTLSQMGVLHYLFKHANGTATLKDIEGFLGLKHPTVVGILKRMEKKGLVESSIDASDRRYRNIMPTEKALAAKAHMDQCRLNMNERLVDGMTPEEIDTLTGLLQRILENINKA